jgi:hypothetical protein
MTQDPQTGEYGPDDAPAFSAAQIQSAIDASRSQGYSDADIAKGALANFGVDISSYFATPPVSSPAPSATPALPPAPYVPVAELIAINAPAQYVEPEKLIPLEPQQKSVDQPVLKDTSVEDAAREAESQRKQRESEEYYWKMRNKTAVDEVVAPVVTPAVTPAVTPTVISTGVADSIVGAEANPFLHKTVATSSGQTYNYDDIVSQINSRYAEGKNPALAVKSALQLGLSDDVIASLPGVDAAAIAAGHNLIDSGAFAGAATGTEADTQAEAAYGSDLYKARIAAGLDAYGFPPAEVVKKRALGTYVEPTVPASVNSGSAQSAAPTYHYEMTGGGDAGPQKTLVQDTPEQAAAAVEHTKEVEGWQAADAATIKQAEEIASKADTGANTTVQGALIPQFSGGYVPGHWTGGGDAGTEWVDEKYEPLKLQGFIAPVLNREKTGIADNWFGHYDEKGNWQGTKYQQTSLEDLGDNFKELAVKFIIPAATMAFGGALFGELGAAMGIENPVIAKLVGNVAINTLTNGGDIEAAVKGAALSYGIGLASSNITAGLKDILASSGIDASTASTIANTAVKAGSAGLTAAASGKDGWQAAISSGLGSATNFAMQQIPGFNDLPAFVKSSVSNVVGSTIAGKPINTAGLLSDAISAGIDEAVRMASTAATSTLGTPPSAETAKDITGSTSSATNGIGSVISSSVLNSLKNTAKTNLNSALKPTKTTTVVKPPANVGTTTVKPPANVGALTAVKAATPAKLSAAKLAMLNKTAPAVKPAAVVPTKVAVSKLIPLKLTGLPSPKVG